MSTTTSPPLVVTYWNRRPGASELSPAQRQQKPADAVSEPVLLVKLVGATGFEPAASRSRTERSTKLSHAPKEIPVYLNCIARGLLNCVRGSGCPSSELKPGSGF